MVFLRRRSATGPPGADHDALGVSGVRFVDGRDPRAEDRAARAALQGIVDRAVLLQGLADDILAGIRERRSLSELAGPCGALISGFVALRAAIPEPADPTLRDAARTLHESLDHHAVMLSCSLGLLGDLRPERVSDQLDQIEGLGAPAERVCELQAQLAGG
jgi:hypothetical protein